MPRGDGTGPQGFGPMTGRALGYCAGYSTPGFTKGVGMGRGRGFGRGAGRGFGRGFRGGRGRGYGYPTPAYGAPVPPAAQPIDPYQGNPYYKEPTKEDQMKYLKDYAEGLKKELEEIESRIEELSE